MSIGITTMMQPIIHNILQGDLFLRIKFFEDFANIYTPSKFFAESSWYLRIHVCIFSSCFSAGLRLHYQHFLVG